MFKESNKFEKFESKVWLSSPTMHGPEIEYVKEAYETNWMSTVGVNINEVEKIAAETSETKYAVALSCGTAALHLCMKLAGERLYGKPPVGVGALQNKRVFCTDMTFNATLNPVVYEGGIPVFIDTEYDSWGMDPVALKKAFEMYPDVKFIAPDVSAGDICEKGVGEGYTYNPDDYEVTDYYNADNVYCCTYQEEISGYMAGYAAVKLGYKHLGFLGGMSVPAVTRFGYGYVQGVDEAAKELGITSDVELEYVCGGQFYGDADITAYMDTWYGSKGVEVVFACGGGIYTSAAEAAAKVDGKVIGVDSDQSGIIGEDITVTSAMKGLAPTVKTALDAIKDGSWESDYAGKIDNLGLVSENPEDNYVQLPMETTQWDDNFTVDDYKDLVKKLYNGEIEVSSDITAMPETEITVNDYGSIK